MLHNFNLFLLNEDMPELNAPNARRGHLRVCAYVRLGWLHVCLCTARRGVGAAAVIIPLQQQQRAKKVVGCRNVTAWLGQLQLPRKWQTVW